MSADPGSTERRQLEDLVLRARTGLRTWSDTTDTEPGEALLQLFTFLGDLVSSHAERTAAEAHLGSGSRYEVQVEVAGQPWHQVSDLAGSGAEDPHYLVNRRDDGAGVITFGDGVHGRRPTAGQAIRVRYGQAGEDTSVQQQGRVSIDADARAEPARTTCGVYRAIVVDNQDPLMHRRLLVRIPEVGGQEPVWAAACLPVSDTQEVAAVGDGVWIAFESCDPVRPVWLGRSLTD